MMKTEMYSSKWQKNSIQNKGGHVKKREMTPTSHCTQKSCLNGLEGHTGENFMTWGRQRFMKQEPESTDHEVPLINWSVH